MKTADIRKICSCILALAAIMILASPAFADDDDPPGRVARLSYVKGNVSFQPSGEDQWSQASLNYPLTTGDRVYTDQDARAELETGNIAIRLSAQTDLTTANLTDQLLQLGLAQGTLRVRAYEVLEGNSIEIDTPNASLTLLRAGSYRVETYPDDNTTLIVVTSGDLEVSGNGFSQVVHSGQTLRLTGSDEVESEWVSAPGRDDFDDWSGDRDRHFQGGSSRQYVGDYVPGAADLDEYGKWEPQSEYGQIWYPTTVAADWAPYRTGRWVWVEPWGWTWVGEEPWGFTPFHYGRWVLIGSRWGWCPGPAGVRPVYAPALVAFVGGGRAGISVWFPLGPRDPFFPSYHHSDVYLRRVNVANVTVRNAVVINNYISVRNVTNVRYEYQRVAPTAVSTEAFRSARPVRQEMVRLNPDEVGRGRIIPHPEAAPDVRAIHAGAPAAHPPVQAGRPQFEQRGPAGGNRAGGQPGGNAPVGNANNRPERGRPNNQPSGGQPDVNPQSGNAPGGNANNRPERGRPNNQPSGAGTQNPPPGQPLSGSEHRVPASGNQNPSAGQQPAQNPPPGQPLSGSEHRVPGAGNQNPNAGQQPAQNNQGNRDARGRDSSGPPQPARPIVTNNPPPGQKPSFEQKQPAMQEHPGRPLEPKQVDNLQHGQPAGAAHDREYTPHQSNSRPAPPPPPPSKPDKPDKDKDHKH